MAIEGKTCCMGPSSAAHQYTSRGPFRSGRRGRARSRRRGVPQALPPAAAPLATAGGRVISAVIRHRRRKLELLLIVRRAERHGVVRGPAGVRAIGEAS